MSECLAQGPPDPEMHRMTQKGGGEGAGDFFERGLAINSGRLETAYPLFLVCRVLHVCIPQDIHIMTFGPNACAPPYSCCVAMSEVQWWPIPLVVFEHTYAFDALVW